MKRIGLVFIVLVALITGCASYDYDISGEWKINAKSTMLWYVENGIPWHVSRDVVKTVGSSEGSLCKFEFSNGRYILITPVSKGSPITGRYDIYDVDNSEILLRLYPDADNFGINKLSYDELIKKTLAKGDIIDGFLGLRFIDKDKAMIFSLALKGKGEVARKLDGLVVEKLPPAPATEEK